MSEAPTALRDALERLAAELRAHEVIAPKVRATEAEPSLGILVAQGPRAAAAPDDYVILFEAIREGYLMHYGEPRLVAGGDRDLRLLAGDYLYAIGLRRLAEHDDLGAIRELGDLISLSAQLHVSEAGEADRPLLDALWLASAVAVGWGGGEAHEAAKGAVSEAAPGAESALIEAALSSAPGTIEAPLARAADSVGFVSEHLPDRG